MDRNNLISNPSFRTNISGWSVGSTELFSRITTDGWYGSSCAQFTRNGVTGAKVSTTDLIFIRAQEYYTASAYVKVPSGSPDLTINLVMDLYDSADTYLTSSTKSFSISSSAGWVRISNSIKPYSVNTSAAKMKVTFSCSNTTSAVFLLDAVMLEETQALNNYYERIIDQAYKNQTANLALSKLPIPHLTGMKLQADVMLGDVVFNTIDENGVLWVVSDIEGWWNIPESDIPDVPRGLDDGSYDVRGRWLPRAINLVGSILVPDPDYVPVARQKLLDAVSLVYSGDWLYVDEEPTKACYVRIQGTPDVTNVSARGRIDFSIPLKAVDPIKYKWNWGDNEENAGYITTTLTTDGSTTSITNEGNISVPVIIEITGGSLEQPVYIKNETTGESVKLVKDLRPNNYDLTPSVFVDASRSAGIATITATNHKIIKGDTITVSGTNDNFNQTNALVTAVTENSFSYANPKLSITSITVSSGTATVTANSHGFSNGDTVYISGNSNPYLDGSQVIGGVTTNTFTFTVASNTTNGTGGTVSKQVTYLDASSWSSSNAVLVGDDTLKIETLNKSVALRGNHSQARAFLDANTDWIKLAPGVNNFTVNLANSGNTPTIKVKYRSGWIG